MIVVVSGIRDLASSSEGAVSDAVLEHAERATEIRFGGALGVDTVALGAVAEMPAVRKVVYVPFTIADQPASARRAFAWADEIIQMRLPGTPSTNPGAYLARNRRMLLGGPHDVLQGELALGVPRDPKAEGPRNWPMGALGTELALGVLRDPKARADAGSLGVLRDPKANRLLAFTDGRSTGGTAATIRMAREAGIRAIVITVRSR